MVLPGVQRVQVVLCYPEHRCRHGAWQDSPFLLSEEGTNKTTCRTPFQTADYFLSRDLTSQPRVSVQFPQVINSQVDKHIKRSGDIVLPIHGGTFMVYLSATRLHN